jgi:hypothetical protein
MNALQIIPPKPATKVRRSALPFRVLDAIVLVALVGGMSMWRGEKGTASEPVVPLVIKDSGAELGSNNKSPAVGQPATASAGATTEGSGSGGSDEKVSASAQPIALSATSAPACVRIDPEVDSEAEERAAAEAKSDGAVGAAIGDANMQDHDSSHVLANLSAISSASVLSKDNVAPRSGAARVRKAATNALRVRSAESARLAYRPRGQVNHRGWKSADGALVGGGRPSVIYGPSPEARAPYEVAPADAVKRQDRMSLAAVPGIWERVVDAPGAVLNGGKRAFYGILDSVW